MTSIYSGKTLATSPTVLQEPSELWVQHLSSTLGHFSLCRFSLSLKHSFLLFLKKKKQPKKSRITLWSSSLYIVICKVLCKEPFTSALPEWGTSASWTLSSVANVQLVLSDVLAPLKASIWIVPVAKRNRSNALSHQRVSHWDLNQMEEDLVCGGWACWLRLRLSFLRDAWGLFLSLDFRILAGRSLRELFLLPPHDVYTKKSQACWKPF